MQHRISKFLFQILHAYYIPVSFRSVEHILFTHPEYPSLQCISDALDSWKVKHVVLKISLEKLRAFNVPAIVPLKRSEYVWVTRITDSKVYYWSTSGKEKNERFESFEKQWSGVALVIEDVTEARDPNFKEERSREIKEKIIRYFFAGVCVILLTLLTCFSWSNDSQSFLLLKLFLLLVNAAGCYISYTLILQEKRQAGRMVQKFCKAGAHIDCNKVTDSRYSKLFGMFSWAELGMAYFTAVILWLTIAPVSSNWLPPLWWFLLAPLPFTVWSLFTQAFLIRKWCLFCCAIVFLLWINAGMLYFIQGFSCIFPVAESLLLVLLLSVCMAVVIFICKKSSSKDLYSYQRETARFKYDFNVMKSQMSEARYETHHTGFAWGNPHSVQELALYVSIACSHCGKAVKELKRLTDIYPDFCFRLIFAVNTDDFKHKSNIITGHLISLYKTLNKNDFFDMLDAWYSTLNKNLEALKKTYPVSSSSNIYSELNKLYGCDIDLMF